MGFTTKSFFTQQKSPENIKFIATQQEPNVISITQWFCTVFEQFLPGKW
jgi:hypothetical protein